ncbi:Hypothetical protein BAN_0900006 [Borrelia anserina BA2]|uniref:Uncharacterized protein n=1 Tax=Borrelia anserina BA2 TaxID=1313293 RepID=W5SMK6_BORAN|nr:Hypothetical protein BAN_0900006 [Borrelia anserina BA2]
MYSKDLRKAIIFGIGDFFGSLQKIKHLLDVWKKE